MNEKITGITGRAIPLEGDDIDTDRIIPARFMKCLTFDGLGQFAFYDMRFDEKGGEKNHVLNDPLYRGNPILLCNRNFGCGSSREHAPWALRGMGIRCIIAQSFGEIFANNCSSLGIPALAVDEKSARELQRLAAENPESEFAVDLRGGTLRCEGREFPFRMPENYRIALTEGRWDTTSMLLENLEEIRKKNRELPAFNTV